MAPSPLCIAYLTTHFPSPSHTFIAGEIRGLEARGVSVSPISVNPVSASELLSAEDKTDAKRTFYVKSQSRLTVVRQAFAFMIRRPDALRRTVRLALRNAGWDLHAIVWHMFYVVEAIVVLRRCESVGASHLHSHFGGTPSTIALYVSELSVAHGTKNVTWSVTIHGFHEFANERASLLHTKVQRAEFVVAISDFTRAQLMRIAEDPNVWPKIHVIRCGIDLDRFAFSPPTVHAPTRILMTARVVAEKGFGVLFDAAAILKNSGFAFEITIVGDGPARAELEQRVHQLGLESHVRWLGLQAPAAVLRCLRESDIFCLPSFAEGLPIVLLEAMAVGVPVVGTFLGGIPELVEDGRTGRLLPAGRADLLAAAFQELAVPSAERDEMIAAARHRVEEFHEMHQSALLLHDLFVENIT